MIKEILLLAMMSAAQSPWLGYRMSAGDADKAIVQFEALEAGFPLETSSDAKLRALLEDYVTRGNLDELEFASHACLACFLDQKMVKELWVEVVALAWVYRQFPDCLVRESAIDAWHKQLEIAEIHEQMFLGKYLLAKYPELYTCK